MIIFEFTQSTIIKSHSINIFKHMKLLQCGSDRYNRRVVAKSCQCRTVCEVDKVLKFFNNHLSSYLQLLVIGQYSVLNQFFVVVNIVL